ncbi:tRNA (5-methylaminomethyl-2-thiouridylate)-methyltransferase [hydrothermal vent metagenome]|uniref:tRNA (5-methylaminomethyl-2-thiouridylate)-methyltransferase n=1 Tax=hydrothermal vent metagenome TaxID=652676 RepID=A0A1W1BRQ1_9ZZZZ
MRALALFSGGLDSMLAIKLIADQGIDVIALHIKTGFGGTKDISDLMKQRAQMAGATMETVDVREEYIQKILFDPVYGYGKNFNPCIDCHGYMFKIARGLMERYGASFLITGEVIGQRPMSQRADAIKQVTKLAQDSEEKLILRPMSAKLMEETTPELEGWVDRDKLLDISGRSREVQMRLAKQYGWDDYESPGGGCLLTEEHFSDRIREFAAYDTLTVDEIDLLKFGRHFRLPDGAKLVVGRNQEDNEGLQSIKSDKYTHIKLPIAGPFSLVSSRSSSSDRELAVKIAITYARSSASESYDIEIGDETITTSPFAEKKEAQIYFFNSTKNKGDI